MSRWIAFLLAAPLMCSSSATFAAKLKPENVAAFLADAVKSGQPSRISRISSGTIMQSVHGGIGAWMDQQPSTAQLVVSSLADCELGEIREMKRLANGQFSPFGNASSAWNCRVANTDNVGTEVKADCYDIGYLLTAKPVGRKYEIRLLRSDVWSPIRCGAMPVSPAQAVRIPRPQ